MAGALCGAWCVESAAWKDKKDGTQVIAADRYLEPHADSLRYRYVLPVVL